MERERAGAQAYHNACPSASEKQKHLGISIEVLNSSSA
jgi:hypothetical protein